VTSVGATTIAPNHTIDNPETAAWDSYQDVRNQTVLYTSGGGFANSYSVPDYQAAAVARYFDIAKPSYESYNTSETSPGVYNRTGRGIPDVAALGQNTGYYTRGEHSCYGGGTSASSPIFAGIITRIIDARMGMGKSVSVVEQS